MKKLILIGFLLLGMTPTGWGDTINAQRAKAYYQDALKAYLDGDYDKAILMDSKALQLDPHQPKAAELLNILTYEMNSAHQTDIWIGSQRGENQAVPPIPLSSRLHSGGIHIGNPRLAPAQLIQLQAQLQMISMLMSRNSEEQAKIMDMAKSDSDNRLNVISKRLGSLEEKSITDDLTPMEILCLLAVLLSIIALMVSMRTRKELKRYKDFFLSHNTHAVDLDKVVPMRFGR